MRLEDKVAVVTGSGKGIGYAIANCMAKEGAHIVVNTYREETGAKVADEIRALGKKITITALSHGGKWFPFPGSQFIFCMSCPPMCEEPHYHGATGFSLDLQSVPEPPYSNCYWGTDVKQIVATPDEIINWFHNKP